MLKKWKRILKASTVSLILIVYLTVGFLNVEKGKSNGQEQKRESSEASPTTSGGETLKTLVGYSLEYKIRRETEDRIICREIKRKFSGGKNFRWQRDPKLDLRVYSAYYDSRQDPYRYVRVIGMLPRNSSFYCQMVYEDGRTVTQKAAVQEIWSAKWGPSRKDGEDCRNYYPSLVGCLLPTEDRRAENIPVRVSFVDENCSGGFVNLSIRARKKPKLKKKFAVCVKPVSFKGYNKRSLEEWIKLNRLLGADKIVFYLAGSDNATSDFLKFAADEKRVEIVKFESPPFRECAENPYEESLWTKRKIEVIAYNDCFYRNLYEAEFVIPLDLDEIIVPKSSENWQEAFRACFGAGKESETPEYASFSVRNAYFFADYPEKAIARDSGDRTLKLVRSNENRGGDPEESIFRRKIRSFVLSPQTDSAKSFLKVSKTLSVFNHYAFHVLGGAIRQYVFPEKVMQLNHYRNACDPVLIDDCQRFLNYVTFDDTLEKFRNKLHLL